MQWGYYFRLTGRDWVSAVAIPALFVRAILTVSERHGIGNGIPEFGNALPQLEHNTAQIVGPGARKDNYKRNTFVMDRYLSWIAGDRGSGSAP